MKIKIQDWEVYALGDHAIVFSLAAKMDPHIVQSITALSNLLRQKNVHGILDIIPSYHTLTVIYDIIQFTNNQKDINELLTRFCTQVLTELNAAMNDNKKETSPQNVLIKVPVCYETMFGLDIENLSSLKHLTIPEIISIHTSKIYEVYSIGFLPGFTYMGIVDEKIQMPRHEKPRKQVLAGSVGIAGLQTGIYPSNSPGGWQIIGRTPWQIFDKNENKLAKFKVGDLVQFYSIDKNDFDKMNEHL